MWQHNASPQLNRYNSASELTPSPVIPSLRTDSSVMNGNCGNSGLLPQSFNLLGMPQLEDSTEIQSFFMPPPNSTFPDSHEFLPHLLPQPPESPQQADQQYGVQLLPNFADFPAETINYYQPPMPVTFSRPTVDFFSEGIPTLHSAHASVPTLPPNLSALDDTQSQDQIALENRKVVDTSTPCLFDSSLPIVSDTDPCPPLQSTLAVSVGTFPARPSIVGGTNTPSEFSPVAEPYCQTKRGGGLALAQEPKFSPDKRKLCCVEGCKSQARAFNRCKRHGGSKRCSSPGCTKSVQSRGLCIRHGGGSRCQEPGCTRASQSHGRCKMHGGGRPCVVAGCEKKAHLKRLCRRHGGGAKCCVTGCDKWAQRQGMCMTHSKILTAQPSDTLLYRTTPPLSSSDSSPPPSLHIFGDEV
ncbi:uncharacterized protein PHALS_05376 [Plasmopara halstedii]|uniref:WRKY19-like zinc finger domain-containing protein n=1 Tax=Plasmopara halstedii TaxID=4781 RepID=A0A0P1ABN0_PLAHL|nr:uncharacterized protein PHALS_05376 [Plasmopara halstedii]CEG37597.1 hypothetical protein PHALS_05376 [Plasmopara halstedii]|eukprot:XP_024573966.1 hypothetical protein PHALS_05376 [Plasmopara halstedii]